MTRLQTSEFSACVSAGGGSVQSGAIIDGSLRLSLGANWEVTLTWGPSCLGSDTDFAIYEGATGDFTSHERVQCSTGGLTNATVDTGVDLGAARQIAAGTDCLVLSGFGQSLARQTGQLLG